MNVLACVLIPFLLGASSRASAASAVGTIPGSSLSRYEVADDLGRRVTYYVSRPSRPAPILLLLQGSGCSTVLKQVNGSHVSSVFGLFPIAADGRFTVVAVEKPSAVATARGGTAEDCTSEFNQNFTAESWLVAVQASLKAARQLPWVDKRRTLIFGASEGAVMASLLARRDETITDVVAISGSGTSQLFDFVAHAYQYCFDRAKCLDDVQRNFISITQNPDSATHFAWGHPFKRWTSFFRIDPGDELVRSRARVYLALGTSDTSVPALSQEIAIVKLLLAKRDVTVRRVVDGDHSLLRQGSNDYSALDAEYRRALDWFWAAPSPKTLRSGAKRGMR